MRLRAPAHYGSRVLIIGGVAAAYFLAAALGFRFASVGMNVALFWPPTGVALAAILRFGPGAWIGIALGALANNVSIGSLSLVSASLVAGQTLGPLVAAMALRRAGFDRRFSRRHDCVAYAVVGPLAMIIPGLLGATILAVAGRMPAELVPSTFLAWWLGDTIGVLTVGPMLLTLDRGWMAAVRHRTAEFALLIVVTAVTGYFIWVQQQALPISFVSLLPLVWAAGRFEPRIPHVVMVILVGAAVYGTALGTGPFAGLPAADRAGPLAGYVIVVAAISLLTGALTAEQSRAYQSLAVSQRQVETANMELRKANSLLQGIENVQSTFIAGGPEQVSFGQALGGLLELSGSDVGFIGEVDRQGDQFSVRLLAASTEAWTLSRRASYPSTVASGTVCTATTGPFATVITTGRPAIFNAAAAANGHLADLPPLPVPLATFVAIPIECGGEIVGVAGIANRPGGYLPGHVDRIHPLLSTTGALINAKRAERGRTEAVVALAHNERRLADIIGSAMDAIITINDDHRIVVFNRAAERLFGIRADGAIGEPLSRFLPPELRTLHGIDAEPHGRQPRHRRSRSSPTNRVEGLRADGTTFPAEASISQTGEERLFTVIIRDISERLEAEASRQRLEARLQQSRKLEAIGTLAGGIAHDFNNILGAIMGNAELGRDDVGPDGPARHSFEQILVASRRARDLVRQILWFTRQRHQGRAPTDLGQLIDEVVALVRPTTPPEVELEVVLADCPPVLGDPSELHQVVLNLCANGIQAMPDGGVLRLSLAPVVIDPDNDADVAPGAYLHLEVRDTGSGIDPATLPRVFEPFFTTKAPGRGTGLGLAVVHGIVSAHGGSVSVMTEPGTGTTFTVLLPAGTGRLEPPPARKGIRVGGGEQILLVDDEPALVSVNSEILRRLGYRVDGFTDPQEAIAAFRTAPERFDLVLTDLMMPTMSGADLAATMAGIRPDLPILVATGYGSIQNGNLRENASIRGVIQKPTPIDELAVAVREALATAPT